MKEIRILAATGIMGSGYRESSLKRGMDWRPDFIGCDSGTTDAGPYYLGSGKSHFSNAAYRRDLALMVKAGRQAKIPVIVGSAGTGGADVHVERILGLLYEIAESESLHFRLGIIRSEQDRSYLTSMLQKGRVRPLANAPELTEATIARSERIVGMAGVEPFMEALDNGAEVIIAGRSSDTSVFASLPIKAGLPPGAVWHAAKILECGAACVKQRKYPDCMFGIVREGEFVVEPPNEEYACTPVSVASHMLYENASPYMLVEPSGTLNTKNSQYQAVNDRSVRVTGSEFIPAPRYTIKLEGAEKVGYQSIVLGGVRDPLILKQLDAWLEGMQKAVEGRFLAIYGEGIFRKYKLHFRVYGRDATMGKLESDRDLGHEVGIVIQITAETQDLATALASSAGHIALHYPIPEWSGLITGLAYPYSPAEIERGAVYRFNLNHVVEPERQMDMFRVEYRDV